MHFLKPCLDLDLEGVMHHVNNTMQLGTAVLMQGFNPGCLQEAITTSYLVLASPEIIDGKWLILWLHLSDVASCYTQDYFASDSVEVRAPPPIPLPVWWLQG